jgi:hypothetical protein
VVLVAVMKTMVVYQCFQLELVVEDLTLVQVLEITQSEVALEQ